MKSISNLPAVTVAMMVCAVLFCAIDFSRAAFLAPATTTTKTISKYRGLNGNLLHVRKSTNVKMVDVKNKNDTNEDSKFNFQIPNFPDLPDMKDAISDNIASLQNFQSSSSNNSQSTNSAAAGSKISSALAASSSQPTPSSSLSITQPPPPPFNPTDPETLISITKSFIATDFGIQTDQVQSYSTGPPQTSTNRVNGNQESLALVLKSPPPPPPSTSSIPFYGASLLSDDFLWVSANNLNDGRTGLLNKNEYLAAGRFFNLRRSFPDLEYKAHDFRLEYNPNIKTKSKQGGGVQGSGDDNGDDIKEITIRFTTLTTGTFRGAPLRLRSSLVEPNGKVMKCPPTSISITFSTDKTNTNGDYGKITKLVTDMVIDRQVGNTNGLSGIAAAAVCAGCPPNEIELYPPLMVLERFFARPMKPLEDKRDEDDGYLPPFPGSVMIQLAKGVTASYFGIDDPDLLSNSFSYIEPLMGPLNKEQYVDLFSTTYNVRDGIPNINYQFQNYRVDPYNPYRVWVDTRARGLRIGDIGNSKLPKNVPSAMYEAPPETMSFTFDNDGFCMRITGAAVLDPLLGNTGGLGGVYGALYSTGSPVNSFKSRTSNVFWNRVQKSILGKIGGVGVDSYKLSDGRVVNGMLDSGDDVDGGSSIGLASSPSNPIQLKSAEPTAKVPLTPNPPKLPPPPTTSIKKEAIPFFAQATSRPTITVPKVTPSNPMNTVVPSTIVKTSSSKGPPTLSKDTARTKSGNSAPISASPSDPVTDAFSSIFGTNDITSDATNSPATSRETVNPNKSITQQLREAAQAARAEAADAKLKAAEQKRSLEAERQQVAEQKISQEAERQQAEVAREMEAKMVEAKKETESSKKDTGVIVDDNRTSGVSSMFSFPSQSSSRPSSKTPTSKGASSKVSTTSAQLSQPKRSSTFSLFNSSSPSSKTPLSKGASSKVSTTSIPLSQPKRSSTFSLFSLSKTPPKKVSKNSLPATKSSSQPKTQSPTPSLFAASSRKASDARAAMAKPSKQTTPSTPRKKPTTNKTFGISAKNAKPKATTSTPSFSPQETPTFNIFGGGAQARKIDTTTKTTTLSTPPQKSPTFNLFGSETNRKETDTATKTKTSSASSLPQKTPTFSIFGGGGKGAPSDTSARSPRSATPLTKKQEDKKTSTKLPSEKPPSNGFFGGMFTNGSNTTNKGDKAIKQSNIIDKQNSRNISKPPKGVPTLKQWKVYSDNSIAGRIFGSSSFKDGTMVTTSPISSNKGGKAFKGGSLVQTKSGSKYFLD